MHSLQQRLLITAGLVLAAFLGVTGWTLEQAYRNSARAALHERQQARLYGLLAQIEVLEDGQLQPPQRLADERFTRPGGELAALIADDRGRVLWRSPSLLGQALPELPRAKPGAWEARILRDGEQLRAALTTGILWLAEDGELPLQVSVIEDLSSGLAEYRRYTRSLWGWLLVLGLGLSLSQVLVLRWALAPTRRVAGELAAVESGERDTLGDDYPPELSPLTEAINALLERRGEQLRRSRETAANLAHSLKTPLALLQSQAEDAGADAAAMRQGIRQQAGRLREIIDYQLQRAGTAGAAPLRAPLPLATELQRVLATLGRVHHERGLRLELQAAPDLAYPIDRGDLLELAGNLLDNAGKWARQRVLIGVERGPSGVWLGVEDDGPGIAASRRSEVLTRGQRLDEQVEGQGIGLAVVADIAASYDGRVEIDDSPTLGGARVRIWLPVRRR